MNGNQMRGLALGLAMLVLGFGSARADLLYAISESTPNTINKLNNLATFDTATGQTLGSVAVPGTNGGFRDIISDHQGGLYLSGFPAFGDNTAPIGDDVLYRLNPVTGGTTKIGVFTDGGHNDYWVEGMAWDNGTLYGSAARIDMTDPSHPVYDGYCPDCSNLFIRIDPATGHVTEIGSFGSQFLNMQNIAYSPQYGLIGADLGTLNPDPNLPNGMYSQFHTTPAIVQIDPTSGVATKIADLPNNPNVLVSNPFNSYLSPEATYVSGLEFTPDGKTLYGSTIQTHFGGTSSGVVTIDPVTGVVTPFGTLDQPLVVGIAFVPEPSSVVLVGLGLLGVGAWRWRSS